MVSIGTVQGVIRKLSTATMPLKFAANISMMFKEAGDLSARYSAAKDAGFSFVESTFPYDIPMEQLKQSKEETGLEQVLINCYPGDMSKGERGLAAVPSKQKEFKESLEKSIPYAKALNCTRMHIMAGLKPAHWEDTAMMEVYVDNLNYAAGRLQEENITALIEPVNSRISVPRYFMDHPAKAVEVIEKVGHKNLKLQLDIFHLQIMDGNLTQNLKKYMPYVGHIQIAQSPDRHEPDSPGEINYSYVFKLLEDMGYDEYIGLEYNPQGSTVEGLGWMKSLSS